MQDEALVWAAWSPDRLVLYRQRRQGAVETISIARKMKADWRYFLKFYHVNHSLLLRSAEDRGACLDIVGPQNLQPMDGLPSVFSTLPPYHVIPMEHGVIAGIPFDRSELFVWSRKSALRRCKLPANFAVRDVAMGAGGSLWICGTQQGGKLQTLTSHRALAMSEDEGISWRSIEPAPDGLRIGRLRPLAGAEAAYRTIRIIAGQVVLSAETEDEEHPSTFLFLRNSQGEWGSRVVKSDILRAVLQVSRGGVEFIFHYGKVAVVTPLNEWRERNLLSKIPKLLGVLDEPPPKNARYEILDAQPAPGGQRVLVVSVRVPGEHQLVRFGEAVLIHSEDGDRLLAFHKPHDPEIVAAGVLIYW